MITVGSTCDQPLGCGGAESDVLECVVTQSEVLSLRPESLTQLVSVETVAPTPFRRSTSVWEIARRSGGDATTADATV